MRGQQLCGGGYAADLRDCQGVAGGRQGGSGGGAIAAGTERGGVAGGDHVADAMGGGACLAEVEMFYWLYEERMWLCVRTSRIVVRWWRGVIGVMCVLFWQDMRIGKFMGEDVPLDPRAS